MKFLKEIFGRIWAIWAIVVFSITLLIFLIPFFLFCQSGKEADKTTRFIAFSRIWMDVYLFLIGCPLTVKGKDFFEKGSNYIVLCNHNSFMDVPVSSPYIPGGNKTIAKIEISRVPVFGWLYKAGSVLVDRKNDQSRKESYLKMKKVLDIGLHMCIYPEGTRNTTDLPLKPFHNGAFKLAVETGKSIIPTLIFNTRKVMPADKLFYLMPHALQIHFLAPVQQFPGESAEELKKRVYQLMETYYTANR